VFLRGAGGESHHNGGDVVIDRNTISARDQHAVHVVGAVGVEGVRTADNVLRVLLSRNLLTGRTPSVAVQAATSAPRSETQGNLIHLRLLDNEVGASPERAFVVSDGPAGNRVEVGPGSQEYVRTAGDLLR
jgi:hypothetical protein